MSGFVVIRREALDHHVVGSNPHHFRAWCWLIATAAWKPTQFTVSGKTITLERGQICASIRQLAEAWSMSKSAVDRFLTRLETETMIERNSGHGRLVLTISNYSKYQDKPKAARDSSGTPSGTTAGQQRDTKEQGNKGTREESNDSSLPPTPHRDQDWPEFPEWLPAEAWNGWLEMRKLKKPPAWPTARAVELTIAQLDKFRAKGHDPGAILDEATQRNWTGIFEPKDQANDRNHSNGRRRATTRESGEAVARRFARAGGSVADLVPRLGPPGRNDP